MLYFRFWTIHNFICSGLNDVIDLIYHPSGNYQGFIQDGYQLIDPTENVVVEEIYQDTIGSVSNHGLVACQSSILISI